MGLTENDTFSPVMRMTTMKIVSDDECRRNQKKDFLKYLTYTSFCAGWANGTSVCNGDSGGGLVIQRPNSSTWEVHGVVSMSPRRLGTSVCDPSFYTVFTKVRELERRRLLRRFCAACPRSCHFIKHCRRFQCTSTGSIRLPRVFQLAAHHLILIGDRTRMTSSLDEA